MGLTERAKNYLKTAYGEHDYDYEMSDINLASLLKENNFKSYEEFHASACELDQVIRDIKEMQRRMHD